MVLSQNDVKHFCKTLEKSQQPNRAIKPRKQQKAMFQLFHVKQLKQKHLKKK